MLIPLILRGPGGLVEPGAAAVGTGGEGDRALHERPDVRLHRVDVLGQERLLDLRDQALVGEVDVVDLHLGRLLVEEVVELLLGVLADRLVRVEEARLGEDAHRPAVGRVAGDGEAPSLSDLLSSYSWDRSMSLTVPMPSHRGHMPPVTVKVRFSTVLPSPFSIEIAPLRSDRGDVEGEGVGRADVRLAEAAEQHPQHRVGVGRRADRRAGVGAHPLLVDDDRGRQPFQDVDLGPGQRRHESLHEGAVGLVDQPLRLRRDGAEHQRRLARSRDAGEHRQPPLGDLDADVLQVVHPRALDADQVVAVGQLQPRVLRVRSLGLAHRVSICWAGRPRGVVTGSGRTAGGPASPVGEPTGSSGQGGGGTDTNPSDFVAANI